MPTSDVSAALLTAAAALPAHFADSDSLTVEPLSAIQATTMSLPGGAIGVECTFKGGDSIGGVVLVVTSLVDHSTGEVLSRDDARTLWTAALNDVLTGLADTLEGSKPGQVHLTDAFDALDAADESEVVGIFSGQTLAAMLLANPATKTGQGASAQLAAAVAAASGEGVSTDDVDGSADEAAAAEGAGAAQAELAAAEADAAAQALAADAAAAAAAPVSPVVFAPLSPFAQNADPRRIDLLRDVKMGVSVELGRARMTVQEILGLTPGSIVELDRAAGAPVDVLVNGKLIAHGEVVVVEEEFAVRISEVLSADTEGRVSA